MILLSQPRHACLDPIDQSCAGFSVSQGNIIVTHLSLADELKLGTITVLVLILSTRTNITITYICALSNHFYVLIIICDLHIFDFQSFPSGLEQLINDVFLGSLCQNHYVIDNKNSSMSRDEFQCCLSVEFTKTVVVRPKRRLLSMAILVILMAEMTSSYEYAIYFMHIIFKCVLTGRLQS